MGAPEQDSTRQEILTLLKKEERLTVDALSERLGLSGVTVRYHLAALKASGFVQARAERRGVGRPVEVYSLTETADELFPRHYDALALNILEQLEASGGKAQVEEIFARNKDRQREKYAHRLAGKPFAEKIAEVTRILDENGYYATWEQEGESFVITEHNCTVANVAKRFAHPCNYELKLIEELLGASVELVQHKAGGGHCCKYIILPRPEADSAE